MFTKKKKIALEELNNYLTGCPLRTQGEGKSEHLKKRCSEWVCIYFSGSSVFIAEGPCFSVDWLYLFFRPL